MTAIAQLDSNGQPVNYLPRQGEQWQPDMPLLSPPTTDRSKAWELDRVYAEETADVMNARASAIGAPARWAAIELPPN